MKIANANKRNDEMTQHKRKKKCDYRPFVKYLRKLIQEKPK